MIYILSLMSEEQLKAFLEKVKGDTSLQEKLKAEGADPVAIAKEAGFIISADDLTKAQSELSDEELEGVAAGWSDPGSWLVCEVRCRSVNGKQVFTVK